MGMPRILAIRKPAVRVGIGQCFPEAAVCELRIPPPTSSSTLARIFITANLGASWSASLPTQRVLESTGVRLLVHVTPVFSTAWDWLANCPPEVRALGGSHDHHAELCRTRNRDHVRRRRRGRPFLDVPSDRLRFDAAGDGAEGSSSNGVSARHGATGSRLRPESLNTLWRVATGQRQTCATGFPGPMRAAESAISFPPQHTGVGTEGSNSMLALKYLLMILGVGLFGSAGALVAYDIFLATQLRRLLGGRAGGEATREVGPLAARPFRPVRARLALQLAAAGALAILITQMIVVIPDGAAGVRISQISGARPGTLYPGVHLITPLVDSVAIYDTREQVYTTLASENPKLKGDILNVQAREGLNVGLAVSVRYRLDSKRLDSIHTNLPQPVGEQVVAPVVSTVYRQLAPNYITREIFATKREELRTKAAEAITARLASDGILVREVLLRDLQLPAEYAKGLEGLLLKEQENERLGTEQEIKQKEVKIAELEAEAQKSRDVKQAEGQAQVRVLQAKAEADAMQYTLPLKQKQIEQSKLEAEARKEATVQNAEANAQATIRNAEAMAQAKVLDSKAEMERRKLLADAEAERIRVTAVADAERMRNEGVILKQNPLLINKIIAEKLSDKLQIMMVPSDGKYFFANDVLKSMNMANKGGQADQAEEK